MPKGISKEDPDYEEKRKKNNEAIRKSRQKAKEKQKKTQEQVENLRKENQVVEEKIKSMEGQLELLKGIFKAHAESTKGSDVAGQAALLARLDNIEDDAIGESSGGNVSGRNSSSTNCSGSGAASVEPSGSSITGIENGNQGGSNTSSGSSNGAGSSSSSSNGTSYITIAIPSGSTVGNNIPLSIANIVNVTPQQQQQQQPVVELKLNPGDAGQMPQFVLTGDDKSSQPQQLLLLANSAGVDAEFEDLLK